LYFIIQQNKQCICAFIYISDIKLNSIVIWRITVAQANVAADEAAKKLAALRGDPRRQGARAGTAATAAGSRGGSAK
jgi:hypothetical protein